MMNYQDLYYFVVVVEKGSIIAAARSLSIPTSTLSRRIQAFEKTIGYKLIHRTAKHFGLTESGQKLYAGVRDTIHELDLRTENIHSELSSLTGEIRITAPIVIGHKFVKPLVMDFMRQHPQVRVELKLGNDNSDLVKQSIDIAFRMGNITLNNWISRPLIKSRYILCASPDFNVANINHPADLDKVPMIVISQNPVWRFSRGKEHVSFVAKPALKTDELGIATDMVIHGFGISCLPEYLVEEQLAAGRLIPILGEWDAGNMQLSMIYPPSYPYGSKLPAKTRAFIDHVLVNSPAERMAQVS